MSLAGLDHVQVAAPAGGETQARAFYGEALGLAELAKPPGLAGRGGAWFALGPQQLHVGIAADFAPARQAHPALAVPARELDALAARLRAHGHPVRWDETIPEVRRCFTDDPWGNRVELVAVPAPLRVRDGDRELSFTYPEMLRFHGGGSPAGVAHAHAVLAVALPQLGGGRPVARDDVSVRTAFAGPGARDGFEAVLRAVSRGRYLVDPGLARPERGFAAERFVFELTRRGGEELWFGVRPGVVSDEFARLAFAADRTPAQMAALERLKPEQATRILALDPEAVYEAL